MHGKTAFEYQWPYLVSFLAPEETIEVTARECGALRRKRRIDSGMTLLRLVLAYGLAGLSLRQTAAWAEASGVASLSDVALLKRFRSSAEWLGRLLAIKLDDRAELPRPSHRRLRIVDATQISKPGSVGSDWRVHLGLDLATAMIDHVELTDFRGGESLRRFPVSDADVLIADRAYGNRSGIASVAEAGGDFIVRLPWNTVPLSDLHGRDLDLFEFLRSLPEAQPGEIDVMIRPDRRLGLPAVPVRLVAVRKSEAAAAKTRKEITQAASRKSRFVHARTLEAAAYTILVTSLHRDELVAADVLDLYRFRWQVEIAFKRLKGILELGELPAKDPRLARTYILSKLLAALLLDDLTQAYVSFSPWGFIVR